MLIFVRRDSVMCVCPTAHINNDRKNFYEELDCERNQKFYVEVFFGLGDFFVLLFLWQKLEERCFFSKFILTFRLAIDARLYQKTKSVRKTNPE